MVIKWLTYMMMLLAEKVSEIVKMFGFALRIFDLYRCCVTSWNGRCCEFPLEINKPKQNVGFFHQWFANPTEAPRTTTVDLGGYHNAVEIKKEVRVPSYRVLGNRVKNNNNPNGYTWWALYG